MEHCICVVSSWPYFILFDFGWEIGVTIYPPAMDFIPLVDFFTHHTKRPHLSMTKCYLFNTSTIRPLQTRQPTGSSASQTNKSK